MPSEWFAELVPLDITLMRGACLWALALYLGFTPWREEMLAGLEHWLAQAGRSTPPEPDATAVPPAPHHTFSASVLSTLPFLFLGLLCNYGVELSLGRSWAVSVGLLAAVGSGVYELGRRTGASS